MNVNIGFIFVVVFALTLYAIGSYWLRKSGR